MGSEYSSYSEDIGKPKKRSDLILLRDEIPLNLRTGQIHSAVFPYRVIIQKNGSVQRLMRLNMGELEEMATIEVLTPAAFNGGTDVIQYKILSVKQENNFTRRIMD